MQKKKHLGTAWVLNCSATDNESEMPWTLLELDDQAAAVLFDPLSLMTVWQAGSIEILVLSKYLIQDVWPGDALG